MFDERMNSDLKQYFYFRGKCTTPTLLHTLSSKHSKFVIDRPKIVSKPAETIESVDFECSLILIF